MDNFVQSQPAVAYSSYVMGDAASAAQSVIATWEDINAALSPILGEQGVAALLARSLLLTSTEYPWLTCVQQPDTLTYPDLALLQTVLQGQSRDNAVAGGGALLHTYFELLDSLLGPALTERLLGTVLAQAH